MALNLKDHIQKKREFSYVIGLILMFLSLNSFAAEYTRDYEEHTGYVSSLTNEIKDDGVEIPFIDKPASNQLSLKEKIFNSELSKEFKDRYEDKFGRTEPERVYNSPNKQTYYDDLYTYQGTSAQVDEQKRDFGNYMMARLVEWHADNYLKSDPSMRPVYEAKERLSQVKVEVDEVKLDGKYSLAGNFIDLTARAPLFDTKITIGSNQRILSFTRAQSPSLGLEARYLDIDKKAAGIVTKRISKTLATSFTASACTGDSTASIRETLYLSGLSYNF